MKTTPSLRALAVALLVTGGAAALHAQHTAQPAASPPLSPRASAEATLVGKKVSIDYGSPRVRGRKIMGELVPYGKVWRTGANAATTLTTETDLMIGGVHVPAGKYTLYTIPGETEWTLIINKQTGQWGTQYDQAQDLGRVKMKVSPLASPREEMTIALRPDEGGGKGTLAIEWESTSATVPVIAH
jgi:hypothetical protein